MTDKPCLCQPPRKLPSAEPECRHCGAPISEGAHVCATCGLIQLPDDMIVCNCAGCRCLLLGPMQRPRYQNLTKAQRAALPPRATWWSGRPRCEGCMIEVREDAIIAPVPEWFENEECDPF